MWICYNCMRRLISTPFRHGQSDSHRQPWHPYSRLPGRSNSLSHGRPYAALATSSTYQETAPIDQETAPIRKLAPAWPRSYLRLGPYADKHAEVRRKNIQKLMRGKPMDVKMELKDLHDPFRLGNRVTDLLARDEFEHAHKLVRAASKHMNCTVSWNHLVNYQMRVKKSKLAIKLYNEMKKRGQLPDSYTYGLIFRGLTHAADPKAAVGKALSVYHSMQTPNSPVKPSIAHVNSLLKVCARVGDMDTLWGVASKLPEQGSGAADAITWTTILNAIRHEAATASGPLLTSEQVFEAKEKAVIQGRRIWGDLVDKWRVGGLLMDEELVGAMGQLLLLGSSPRDWDDVLSLVRQTMNIPRMAARVRPLHGEIEASGSDGSATSLKLLEDGQNEEDDKSGISSGRDLEEGSEFDALIVARPARRERPEIHTVAFARPSYSTLSLLVEACEKLFNKQAATKYWEHFTQNIGMTPDSVNYHAYLRVLRVMRASGEAVEIVREMSETEGMRLEVKTFRIAMAACARDKINPHSISHANQLLDLMQTHLEGGGGDPVSVAHYLQVAVHTGDRGVILPALEKVSEIMNRYLEKEGLPQPAREGNKTEAAKQTKELKTLEELAWDLENGFVRFLNRSGEDRKRQTEYRGQIERWATWKEKISELVGGTKGRPVRSSRMGKTLRTSNNRWDKRGKVKRK